MDTTGRTDDIHRSKASNTACENKATIKPPFQTHTDISRRLDTINKTFNCDRFQPPQKSNLETKRFGLTPYACVVFLFGKRPLEHVKV